MRLIIFLLIAPLLLSACAAQPELPSETVDPPSTSFPAPPSTSSPAPATSSPTHPPPVATGAPQAGTPGIPLMPTATRYSPLATLPQAITPLPLDAAPPELVAEATARLAGKLGLEPGAISLFSVIAVEWPDASIGCPIGGQQYAQVITPGYQIQLEAGRSIYTYHTDTGTQFILCGVEPPHEIYQTP